MSLRFGRIHQLCEAVLQLDEVGLEGIALEGEMQAQGVDLALHFRDVGPSGSGAASGVSSSRWARPGFAHSSCASFSRSRV